MIHRWREAGIIPRALDAVGPPANAQAPQRPAEAPQAPRDPPETPPGTPGGPGPPKGPREDPQEVASARAMRERSGKKINRISSTADRTSRQKHQVFPCIFDTEINRISSFWGYVCGHPLPMSPPQATQTRAFTGQPASPRPTQSKLHSPGDLDRLTFNAIYLFVCTRARNVTQKLHVI